MAKSDSKIGLTELVEQVKQELLAVAPGENADAPMLFVESVELEIQVTVNREAIWLGSNWCYGNHTSVLPPSYLP